MWLGCAYQRNDKLCSLNHEGFECKLWIQAPGLNTTHLRANLVGALQKSRRIEQRKQGKWNKAGDNQSYYHLVGKSKCKTCNLRVG